MTPLKLFDRIVRFLGAMLRTVIGKRAAQRGSLQVMRVQEMDREHLRDGYLYLESRAGKDRWLHMLCPCGCREVLSVNLMTSHRPYWSILWHSDGTLTVAPSIDKTVGCKSHFFIQRSRIVWATSATHQVRPRNSS